MHKNKQRNIVKFIVIKEGKLCLCRRFVEGSVLPAHFFPSGTMERGKSATQTIGIEAYGQLGMGVENVRYTGIFVRLGAPLPERQFTDVYEHYYLVDFACYDRQFIDPDAMSVECAWVSIKEAIALLGGNAEEASRKKDLEALAFVEKTFRQSDAVPQDEYA